MNTCVLFGKKLVFPSVYFKILPLIKKKKNYVYYLLNLLKLFMDF